MKTNEQILIRLCLISLFSRLKEENRIDTEFYIPVEKSQL